jgi:RNA polymerase sigma-70 factor, ECF subfamily
MKPEPRRKGSVQASDEAALVASAQRGDQAAFAALVRLHQRTIYGVAWGLTRNAADADDLAQETFVRAWQALGRFRVGEPMRPWLTRITVNLAYSLFRRRKRRPETPIEPLEEAGMQWAAADDPVAEAEGREQSARLNAALQNLSEDHRTILVLRVVQDLSYEEIAKTLEIPAGTVMSRLSRARAELREKLAEPKAPETKTKSATEGQPAEIPEAVRRDAEAVRRDAEAFPKKASP